jgi:hypothetical protein
LEWILKTFSSVPTKKVEKSLWRSLILVRKVMGVSIRSQLEAGHGQQDPFVVTISLPHVPPKISRHMRMRIGFEGVKWRIIDPGGQWMQSIIFPGLTYSNSKA